ncbi:multisubstrate pseudouridine synthase 7 [Micractinium conductrix]|uniref:Multisubstrate pseudouridine synthase 7 n=1 Tax=Micractinium conductrix TaxID=554055 RepID=A0A2P6V0Y5_9CHLO|nr:multisubstrate pseudouridine synthase 7 [Micractinium conductrix]|eukprot:PSC67745.1 multisubstrate pseudouridine synthase 7 [Micractinium conductrix]
MRLTSLDPPPRAAPTHSEDAAAATAAADPSAAVEAVVQQYAAASGSTSLEPLRDFLTAAQRYHAAVVAAGRAGRGGRGGRGEGSDAAAATAGAATVEAARRPEPLVLEPLADKEARTAVHRLFKGLPSGAGGFPRLETSTVEAAAAAGAPDGSAAAAKPQQCVQVAVSGGRGGGDGGGGGGRGQGQKRRRDADDWAGGALRYTRFLLFKENMDSQQALSSLSKLLRCGHKVFSVAGTKDKRGVTVQQVTAFKVDPGRLAGLNRRLRGMRLGNFEFAADQLHLGDLRGNRFELVLRGVEAASADAVAEAAKGLRDTGFVNYYGLQRFGTGGVPTHRVGAALLRGQWREAVRMLLTPRPDCSRADQAEACRLYLEEGDIEGALRRMPRFLVAEPLLLQALKQHGPSGYLNALSTLPRNLRTMYIHAYQSYLWNSAASHRIATYGAAAAVQGDLVLTQSGDAARAAARNRGRPRLQEDAEGEAAAGAEGEGRDAAEGDDAAAADEDAAGEEVHVVTAAEAAAGTYSIDDVVLPLPGSQTRMPEHATAGVYASLAAADGISLDSSPHGAQEFSVTALAGAYRRVLHRPTDLEFELLHYSHPDADLATTDLQQLLAAQQEQRAQRAQGQASGAATAAPAGPAAVAAAAEPATAGPTAAVPTAAGPTAAVAAASEPAAAAQPAEAAASPAAAAPSAGGGRYLGLQLSFTLPASCYATMLIRELTKQPTSVAHHKAMPHQQEQGSGGGAAAAAGEPASMAEAPAAVATAGDAGQEAA